METWYAQSTRKVPMYLTHLPRLGHAGSDTTRREAEQKALKVLFLVLFFPPVAAIVGGGVGIWMFDLVTIGNELSELSMSGFLVGLLGAAIGFGVGLVVYVAWGVKLLLQRRRGKRLIENAS